MREYQNPQDLVKNQEAADKITDKLKNKMQSNTDVEKAVVKMAPGMGAKTQNMDQVSSLVKAELKGAKKLKGEIGEDVGMPIKRPDAAAPKAIKPRWDDHRQAKMDTRTMIEPDFDDEDTHDVERMHGIPRRMPKFAMHEKKKDDKKAVAKLKGKDDFGKWIAMKADDKPKGKVKEASKMKGEDPCWDGYEMVGKKKKGGKEVPNCVPKKK